MPPRSGGSEADVPRKRSNCRVFATRPSPIIPRSGSLREPMRGHCGARLIGVATGTHARSPLGVLNASCRGPCLDSAGPGEHVTITVVAVSVLVGDILSTVCIVGT